MDAKKPSLLARAGALVLALETLFWAVIVLYLVTYTDYDTPDPKLEIWRSFPESFLMIAAGLPIAVCVYLFWKGRMWPPDATPARRRFNVFCLVSVLGINVMFLTHALERSVWSDLTTDVVTGTIAATVLVSAFPVVHRRRAGPEGAGPGAAA
jgi:hypothetical protein